MFQLNFGVITDLLEKDDVVHITTSSAHLSLNLSLTTFVKVGSNPITKIVHNIVWSNSNSFHARSRHPAGGGCFMGGAMRG